MCYEDDKRYQSCCVLQGVREAGSVSVCWNLFYGPGVPHPLMSVRHQGHLPTNGYPPTSHQRSSSRSSTDSISCVQGHLSSSRSSSVRVQGHTPTFRNNVPSSSSTEVIFSEVQGHPLRLRWTDVWMKVKVAILQYQVQFVQSHVIRCSHASGDDF